MGKFNKKTSVGERVIRHPDITTNKEGGIAFRTDPKTDLTLRTLTFLVGEPKFYGDPTDEINEFQGLIKQVAELDPEYLMKLASYARNEMYLRSAPLFLTVEGAQYKSVKEVMEPYIPTIIRRADELVEVIAYFISKHGEIGSRGKASLPNALKRGIAESFHNFEEYHFAKYDRDGDVKLKDVLKLVYPKPRDENESELFKRIRDRTLTTPETWETRISGKGSTKEAWESIIPKMGYMAKLRNLRNFLKVDVDITPVVEHLTNPKAVAKSKQFPFRFLSAYKVLQNEDVGDPFKRRKLTEAVAVALELSAGNIPRWGGTTFVTTDNSGSMENQISTKSTVKRIEVGNIMGAMAHKISDNAIASTFGVSFRVVNINPMDSILTNADKLIHTNVGHATNAWLALDHLIRNGINVDRILIFSDMQCYSTTGNRYGYWSEPTESLQAKLQLYKRQVNPNVRLYSFDLAGYGTTQFPQDEPNVVLLAGWSDKVLTFIRQYENFGKSMIDTIEQYNPFERRTTTFAKLSEKPTK